MYSSRKNDGSVRNDPMWRVGPGERLGQGQKCDQNCKNLTQPVTTHRSDHAKVYKKPEHKISIMQSRTQVAWAGGKTGKWPKNSEEHLKYTYIYIQMGMGILYLLLSLNAFHCHSPIHPHRQDLQPSDQKLTALHQYKLPH